MVRRDISNMTAGRLKNFLWIVFMLILAVPAAMGKINRILLVGDSITQGKGSSDNLGFRDELLYKLLDLGYPFRFVGSSDQDPFRAFFQAGAYTKNFYPGSGGDGLYDVGPQMGLWKPHIVVIHLGTNDFWLPYMPGGPYSEDGGLHFTTTVSGHLARLIRYLLQWHDGTKGDFLETIFLCRIIPKYRHHRHMGETAIPYLNEELVTMHADIEAGRVPDIPPGIVRLVDQYSTFIDNEMLDMEDWTHPNNYGYRHMAEIFLEAFRTLPLHLTAADSSRTSELPNTLLADSTGVTVTNDFGEPQAGVDVFFSVTAGDAAIVSADTVRTDSLGRALIQVQTGYADSSVITAYAPGLVDSMAALTISTRGFVQGEGDVRYWAENTPVPGVSIEWRQKAQILAQTDHAGKFVVDYLPRHVPVTLVPEKTEPVPWEDSPVLSYDAALVARHVVGLDSLSWPMILAADADGDSAVTMADAVTIARYVVGLPNPGGERIGSWLFDPSRISWDSLDADLSDIQFTALLVGDVHGGWAEFQSGSETGGALKAFNQEEIKETRPDTVRVPFDIEGDAILACDFRLCFDAAGSQFLSIRTASGEGGLSLLYREIRKGVVRAGMYMTGPAKEACIHLEAAFLVSGGGGPLNVWLEDLVVNRSRKADRLLTGIASESGPAGRFRMAENYPNPFNEFTVIPFHLERDERIRIRILNVLGREIMTLADEMMHAGDHEIIWDGRNSRGGMAPTGTYLVEMRSRNGRVVQKLEKIR